MKYIIGVVVLASALLLAGAQTPLARSAAGDSNATEMQTLIGEVRELRRTVQQLLANNMRAQFVWEQYRVEQKTVDALEKELRATQAQLTDSANLRQQLEQAEHSLAEQAAGETDANRLKELNEQRRALRQSQEQTQQQEQRLREGEAQLQNALATGQSKLTELRDRLEAIEREMAAIEAK